VTSTVVAALVTVIWREELLALRVPLKMKLPVFVLLPNTAVELIAKLLLRVILARDVESVPPEVLRVEAVEIALADAITTSPNKSDVPPL